MLYRAGGGEPGYTAPNGSGLDPNVLYTSSNRLWRTTDGGDSWKNVTPPNMPDFGRVSLIDASASMRGKAYVSARLSLLDDFRPHVWRTEDSGDVDAERGRDSRGRVRELGVRGSEPGARAEEYEVVDPQLSIR